MARPRKKQPQPGERVPLGLRVTAELKHRLDAAAKESGRSQSQEAELRLERSFQEERVLGGRKVQAIVNMIAATFAHSGQMYARADGKPNWETDAWIDDEFCYNEAMMSTIEALVSGMPGGTPTENEVKDVLTRAFNRILSDMINSGKWENPFSFEGDDND